MTGTLLISSDCHATAKREDYRAYLDAGWHREFDQWVESMAGQDEGLNAHPDLDEALNWDSERRVLALEAEGTVAEVIFPNALPFGYNPVGFDVEVGDRDRAMASMWAYNRWLADFCSLEPHRRAGIALVRFDDVDDAVATVQWAIDHDMRGIGLPGPAGDPWYFDPALDPFWAACEQSGLPVVAHAPGITPRPLPTGYAALMTLALESDFFAGRSLWQMMLGGVFDRFPALRLVLTESGADWIDAKLDEIDRLLDRTSSWSSFASFIGREATMERRPWEYWESNCWVGASFMSRGEARRRDRLGPHKMMFGVDFPHFESTTGKTERWIRSTLGTTGASAAETEAILGINAAEVYRFDRSVLQPIADRVGFEMERLLTPAERPIRDFRAP
jgi:predicted TIM-barrel fold metal-dependent hydrolase